MRTGRVVEGIQLLYNLNKKVLAGNKRVEEGGAGAPKWGPSETIVMSIRSVQSIPDP